VTDGTLEKLSERWSAEASALWAADRQLRKHAARALAWEAHRAIRRAWADRTAESHAAAVAALDDFARARRS
jgi:hypothetical protein